MLKDTLEGGEVPILSSIINLCLATTWYVARGPHTSSTQVVSGWSHLKGERVGVFVYPVKECYSGFLD